MSRPKITEILTDEDICIYSTNERYTLYTLTKIFNKSSIDFLKWLAVIKLVPNRRFCERCNVDMSIIKDVSKTLNYRWTCRCRKNKTAQGAFLDLFRIPADKLILIMYLWCRNDLLKDIVHETELNDSTVGSVCRVLQEICLVSMGEVNDMIGGVDENGLSIVVEIDESQFSKRKYNRGRLTRAEWILGGMERNTKRCFLVPVDDRKGSTLIEIIKDKVAPGSTIVTDGWLGYRDLAREEMYEHRYVIHEENFISPENPFIHTQNIENLWLQAKRKMKASIGLKNWNKELYFGEFMFKRYHKGNVFSALLKAIAEIFD